MTVLGEDITSEGWFSQGDLMRRMHVLEQEVRVLQAQIAGGLLVTGNAVIEASRGGTILVGSEGRLVIDPAASVEGLGWNHLTGGVGALGGEGNANGTLVLYGPNGEDIIATLDNTGLEANDIDVGDLDAGTADVSGDLTVGGLADSVEGWGSQGGNLYAEGDPPKAYDAAITCFDCSATAGWPFTGSVLSAISDPVQGQGQQFAMPNTAGVGWQMRAAITGEEWSDWRVITMPGTTTPPTGTTTSTWSATWAGAWRTVFNDWRDDNVIKQGQYAGFGNHRGLWGFDDADIRATLSGRTIERVRIRVTRDTGGVYAGQTPEWWTHNYANEPTSGMPALANGGVDAGSLSIGQTAWVTLPNSFGNAMRDNTAKGIAVYTSTSSPYMVFAPTATLEVKHT